VIGTGITRRKGPLARADLHGRMEVVQKSERSEKARKTGEAARSDAGGSRRFTLARARRTSLSESLIEDHMAKKGEEGKEDRQGRHQEGGKKDFEEEVVASTIERLRLGLAPGRKSESLP
jgi:hypothetical protein